MNKRIPEGTWQIVAFRDGDEWVPVVEGSNPHLLVEADRVGGTGGINRLMANTVDLPLGPLAMTKMAGPEHLMSQEDRIASLLTDATDLIAGMSGMFLLREGLPVVEFVREGTEPV